MSQMPSINLCVYIIFIYKYQYTYIDRSKEFLYKNIKSSNTSHQHSRKIEYLQRYFDRDRTVYLYILV